MMNFKCLLWITLGLIAAAPAFADAGKILVDSKGMTVYVYDADSAGVSNCNNGCARAWPPVEVPATLPSGHYSAITRKDGSRQLAYENRPLYTYAGDSNPGDTTGDGLGGVWHIVPADDNL